MGFVEYLLVAIVAIIIFLFFIIAIYCRVQKIIDKKKLEIKKNSDNNINISNNKSTVLKRIYRVINSYVYGLMRYLIIKTGHIPSHKIRNILYRLVFNMNITKRTVIYGGCEIRSPWNIKADNCVISTNCILDGRNGIVIGQNVVFGSGVHIWTEEHDVNSSFFAVSESGAKPVLIEDRAWICSDSTILPGVVIHEGAVLASKAVATKDCASYTINAGIPAKKIGDRNSKLEYVLNGKPVWHFW